MSKVWLITGSGNRLGRDIAEAVLAAGDSVVARALRTEELAPLVAQYGEQVKPVKLEVRDEAAAKADCGSITEVGHKRLCADWLWFASRETGQKLPWNGSEPVWNGRDLKLPHVPGPAIRLVKAFV